MTSSSYLFGDVKNFVGVRLKSIKNLLLINLIIALTQTIILILSCI